MGLLDVRGRGVIMVEGAAGGVCLMIIYRVRVVVVVFPLAPHLLVGLV